MATLLSICKVQPLNNFRLRLTLSNETIVERDVSRLIDDGPVFAKIRSEAATFAQAHIENGTVAWPDGADLCPDVLIWGGMPPEDWRDAAPPQKFLVLDRPD